MITIKGMRARASWAVLPLLCAAVTAVWSSPPAQAHLPTTTAQTGPGISAAVLTGEVSTAHGSPATNLLGGASHNSYTPQSLGGPLRQLWRHTLPARADYALESGGRVFVQSHSTIYALSAVDGHQLWAIDTGSAAQSDVGTSLLPADANYGTSSMALDGNTLISSARADRRVVAYDVATGKPRWSVLPSADPRTAAGLLIAPGNGVVYVAVDDDLQARATSTGALLWTATRGNDALAYGEGAIIRADTTCGIEALNPADGTRRWDAPRQCSGALPVGYHVVADGRAYAGGLVYDLATGNVTGSWDSDVTVVVAAGHLLTMHEGTLTASDAMTGAREWSFAGDGTVSGQPFVAGSTVYVVSAAGLMYELDLHTGQVEATDRVPAGYAIAPHTFNENATMSIGDAILLLPAGRTVTAFGATAYAGPAPAAAPKVAVRVPITRKSFDVGNYLGNAAHNNVMGSLALPGRPHLAWTRTLAGAVTSPLITRRRVVAVAWNQGATNVYAFSRATGAQLWHRQFRGRDEAFVAGAGGHVYVQTYLGVLADLDLVTGRTRWVGELVDPQSRAWWWKAPLTVFDHSLYSVASGSGGTLFAVDRKVGRARWLSHELGGSQAAPAVVGGRLIDSENCVTTTFGRAHGLELWRSDRGCVGGISVTGVVDRGLVYADSQGSPNLRIGVNRGHLAGSFTADREPAVAGTVIFTASADALRAEDLVTHRVIWERQQNFALPPLVVGRTVIGVHADGTVVQFRATTGRQLWRSHTGTVPIYPPDVDRVPTAPAAAHGVLAVPEGDDLVVFAS